MPVLTAIAFDADDTLWHNERFFQLTQARFAELLAGHAPREHLAERLLAAERRNLGRYGFGIKAFTLSMIETALDVTGDEVPGQVVREIINAGHEMLAHPVELLSQAREAVEALAPDHTILLVTKGDLLDQERKLAQSGLGDLFDVVEIVSDKSASVYASLFRRHGVDPGRAMMVGNSIRSDVLPALEAGAWATHVPHDITWAVEEADAPVHHPQFRQISSLGDLPGLVADLRS